MAQNTKSAGRQQQEQHAPMTNNESVAVQDRLRIVLAELDTRGEELKGVLPKDLPLVAFLANVNQALRNNPKLLKCTFDSLIDACVKAAYDGLRIDGKEAAIVDAMERYKDAGGAWRDRMVARYMPMVYGLIKQIVQSGAALDVKAVIAYSNEEKTGRFTLLEGTTPGIHHQPFVAGEDKGDMIGAYAIAQIAVGVYKFEWMDRAAILDVKEESKTDKVWARWPTEMWKKTVVRRLRKSLSGTAHIRDEEARQMFPQFDRSAPHPQLAALPTARPTRAALADRSGEASGTPLDLGRGAFHDREGDLVENGREEDRQPAQQQQQQRDVVREQAREVDDIQLPEDERAWAAWSTDVEAKIAAAKSAADVDQVWAAAAAVMKHASKAIRDRLTGKVTDRNTALALGEDDSSADDAV